MPDIAKLIADLKELEAKATPGPWYIPDQGQLMGEHFIADINSDADLDLIAAMRNALPILLQELQRLKLEVAEADYLDAEASIGANELRAENERLKARAEKAEAERDSLIRHMSESPGCMDIECPVAKENGAEYPEDGCSAAWLPLGGKDCQEQIRLWAEREAAKRAVLKAMYPDVAETFDRLEREATKKESEEV